MDNFETEDVKLIMSKIMQTMMDPSQQEPFKADISQVKPTGSVIGQDSPPKSRKVGAKTFEKNTYNRMLIRQQKRNDSVRKLKERLDKQEAERIKKKPEIDKKSKQMIGSSTPLHQRVPDMIEEKQRRMKELAQKRQEEQAKIEEPDLTFRPKILHPNKGEKRDFYDYSQQWRDKKLVYDQIRKLEVEEQRNKHLTFRPQVDSRSEVIAQNVNQGKPVEVRLNQRLKLYQQSQEQKRVSLMHSFAPTISKKSEEIAKKNVENNVFSRLYSASKQVLVPEVSVEEEEEAQPQTRNDLNLQFLMGGREQNNSV